jgi:hypothetical protein
VVRAARLDVAKRKVSTQPPECMGGIFVGLMRVQLKGARINEYKR